MNESCLARQFVVARVSYAGYDGGFEQVHLPRVQPNARVHRRVKGSSKCYFVSGGDTLLLEYARVEGVFVDDGAPESACFVHFYADDYTPFEHMRLRHVCIMGRCRRTWPFMRVDDGDELAAECTVYGVCTRRPSRRRRVTVIPVALVIRVMRVDPDTGDATHNEKDSAFTRTWPLRVFGRVNVDSAYYAQDAVTRASDAVREAYGKANGIATEL